ncbi:hypothetical protein C6341_g25877 [Phytophthora cactorum]|nr:hypothetical protein C6341_g25877 [Phytophthora cactorum]
MQPPHQLVPHGYVTGYRKSMNLLVEGLAIWDRCHAKLTCATLSKDDMLKLNEKK